MIILRKLFSSPNKKNEEDGEETKYQKMNRKERARTIGTLVGVPIAALGTTISAGITENKYKKGKEKIDELSAKHGKRIDDEYEAIKNKIEEKSNEVKEAINKKYAPSDKDSSFDRIKKRADNFNSQKNRINAEYKLNVENINRATQKRLKLIDAEGRLLNRLNKKVEKAHLLGSLGSIAVGTGLGIAAGRRANKFQKKRNEEYNRERRSKKR